MVTALVHTQTNNRHLPHSLFQIEPATPALFTVAVPPELYIYIYNNVFGKYDMYSMVVTVTVSVSKDIPILIHTNAQNHTL